MYAYPPHAPYMMGGQFGQFGYGNPYDQFSYYGYDAMQYYNAFQNQPMDPSMYPPPHTMHVPNPHENFQNNSQVPGIPPSAAGPHNPNQPLQQPSQSSQQSEQSTATPVQEESNVKQQEKISKKPESTQEEKKARQPTKSASTNSTPATANSNTKSTRKPRQAPKSTIKG